MASKNRIWVLGGVLVMIIVVALGGLLGVKPQLDAAASNNEQRESTEALNAQHRRTLAALKEEFAQVETIRAQLGELRGAVPASTDLDGLINDVAAWQSGAGVAVKSYTSTEAIPFVASEDIAATVPVSITSSNMLTMDINIVISGSRDSMLAFVNAMQTSNRLILVKSVNVSDDDEMSISAVSYVLLDTPLTDPNAAPAPTVDATAAE